MCVEMETLSCNCVHSQSYRIELSHSLRFVLISRAIQLKTVDWRRHNKNARFSDIFDVNASKNCFLVSENVASREQLNDKIDFFWQDVDGMSSEIH